MHRYCTALVGLSVPLYPLDEMLGKLSDWQHRVTSCTTRLALWCILVNLESGDLWPASFAPGRTFQTWEIYA